MRRKKSKFSPRILAEKIFKDLDLEQAWDQAQSPGPNLRLAIALGSRLNEANLKKALSGLQFEDSSFHKGKAWV